MEAKKLEKFIKILKIELDDVEEDLRRLEEYNKAKALTGEISNYVSLENLAVIKDELMGIRRIAGTLDTVKPEEYRDIEDFIQKFETYCRQNSRNADLPESVYVLFNRKIEKIKQFMLD